MIRAAVRRPVAATMAYAAVALLGLLAWRDLPVELLPDAELPRLTVDASWPGASPETVEAFLTAPLEAVLQQVRSVERIESVSEEGSARVRLAFEADADMRFVRLDLSERLRAFERGLPPGVRGPFVQAYVPAELAEQARAFMRYTVTGPLTAEALRELVDTAIAPVLRDVDGVAAVVAAGGRRRVLDVEIDAARAHAAGLQPEQVSAAVASIGLRRTGGAIERAGLERPLALQDELPSIDGIADLPVVAGNRLVRLRDVAAVHDTWEDVSSLYRVDGRPAVTFEVFRAPRTNAIAVGDAVRARLDGAALPLPANVRLILDEDQGEAIRAQMGELRTRALIGAAVILLVLLSFLRSVRSSLIVCATIAFSILLTLALIHLAGLTLNLLTLMGLAMGFGLIDDNAIVVLESVHRRWRLGDASAVAAERGAREVLLPVFASTATTVVVVAPFVWLQGELRAYYLPLGLVVGCAMIASLLVSFTFVPAVAARGLRPPPIGRRPTVGPATARKLARRPPASRLARLPTLAARHPWPVVSGALLVFGVSFLAFHEHVPRGVRWTDWWNDRNGISITIELPHGADVGTTDEYARVFENRLARTAGVERYTSRIAGRRASIEVALPDSVVAGALPAIVEDDLVALSHQLGGADVRVFGFGPSFRGGGTRPPSYAIQVLGYEYAAVREIAEDLGRRLRRFPRVRDVDTNATGGWLEPDRATEIVLRLDRARMAAHGLTARDVLAHVGRETANAGSRTVLVAGQERALTLGSRGARDADVLDLERSLVRAPGGAEVRLGAIASFEEQEVMSRIVRENQQYRRVVTYEFHGPGRLGDRHRDAVVAATALPAGFALETGGGWSWDEREKRQVGLVVVAALALVFMVTAALFESLRQPFIVLLTVPMALTGVFLTFRLTGASFTREAYVGSIMMAGIVVNNAILLVDRHNQLARAGAPPAAAAAQAALDRAQPILMTTATTVLGMLPLVLFSGSADANIWNGIGYALIGGLLASTALVLTVTPALLVVFAGRRARG